MSMIGSRIFEMARTLVDRPPQARAGMTPKDHAGDVAMAGRRGKAGRCRQARVLWSRGVSMAIVLSRPVKSLLTLMP
jgi:hypothetical protein